MARSRGLWSHGVALAALLAVVSAARAEDLGLPATSASTEVLRAPAPRENLDFAPTGSVTTSAAAAFEPALPPEAPPPVMEPTPPTVADRLPFAVDALIARRGGLPALGAGDWRAARAAVRELYAERALRPIWTEGQGLNRFGTSLLARLKRAGEDGLDLKPFQLPEAGLSERSADRLAEIETNLSAAAVVYALQATGARIAPSTLSPLVGPKVEVADPLWALIELAVAIDPGERLREFNPPQPGYRDLREKLAELDAARTTAANPDLSENVASSPASRARLARFASARTISSDAAPAARVAFAGPSTAAERAAIEANMEMWRWQPREMGRDRIEINIPDYTLKLYEHGEQADEVRVIVGKPATPTPIFSNSVKYLLVNPIWRVPDSIVKKEMLPKAAQDPDYLQRHGFNVKEIRGQVVVEQPPGEGNALGRLLFMFPNAYSVYLHDTPSRGLFSAAKRAFSHGCIRVEQPMRLAAEVMGGAQNGWSPERVGSLIGPNERWVFVPEPLPIHIEYFTEFVDGGGALREREDIYGLTERVAATLARLGQD